MAIVNAQAKLYQGTYSSVVDVILLPSTLSSNFSISCIISRRVSYEANIQGNGSIAASTLGYQTKGGGNKTKDGFFIQNQRYKITSLGNTDWNDISGSSLTPTVGTEFTAIKSGDTTKTGQAMLSDWVARSTLVCQFPTYVRIDVDKLMLPEGTDVRLELEEGFVIEGDFFESKRSPLSKNTNLITFRTPKRFYSQILASQYSLGAVTGFKRFAQINTNSIASIVARITYNPGKFASLVVTNFANTTFARKTVRSGSVMSSQFAFPIGPFRARLFDSTFVTSPFTLTQPSENARVRFGVGNFTNQILQQTSPVYFKGSLQTNLSNQIILDSNVRKIVDPVVNIQTSSSMSCQGTKTAGAQSNQSVQSTIEIITDMRIIFQTDLNYTDYTGAARTPTKTVMIPLGPAFEFETIYGTTDITIDWGDGQTTNITKLRTANESQLYHTYANHGTYDVRVKVNGNQVFGIGGIGFLDTADGNNSNYGEAKSEWFNTVKEIKSWGVNTIPNAPTGDVWLGYLFANIPNNPNFKLIDHLPPVTGDIRFDFMFANSKLNPPELLNWNMKPTGYTYRVPIHQGMFYGASNFNQPIGVWDISNHNPGFTPIGMFNNSTSSFNQDLGNWYSVRDLYSTPPATYNWWNGVESVPYVSQENYNRTLIGWANRLSSQSLPDFKVRIARGPSHVETNTVYGTGTYQTGIAARNYLQSQGWVFV